MLLCVVSAYEAVASAKATNIVANLRAMQVAALSYYEEHSDAKEITQDDLKNDNLIKYIKKTNKGDAKDDHEADILNAYKVVIDAWGDWYARCDIAEVVNTKNEKNTERKAILRKLGGKSRSQGISFSKNADGSARTQDEANQQYIYMWIR